MKTINVSLFSYISHKNEVIIIRCVLCWVFVVHCIYKLERETSPYYSCPLFHYCTSSSKLKYNIVVLSLSCFFFLFFFFFWAKNGTRASCHLRYSLSLVFFFFFNQIDARNPLEWRAKCVVENNEVLFSRRQERKGPWDIDCSGK